MRVFQEGRGSRRAIQGYGLRAQGLREAQHGDAPVAVGFGEPQKSQSLDKDDRPLRIERVRHPLAGAHELLRLRIRTDGDENPIAGDARARALRLQRTRGGLHAVRDPAQRDLPQRHEILLAEEALDRGRHFIGNVDLASTEPCDQVVGRQIDQLDVVGLVENLVGQGLALPDAGRLVDEIVQALEVLDVYRRPDADAGCEQLLDVLPALRMSRRRIAAGDVGVGELVDQKNGRMPGEGGIQVELPPDDAAVSDR